MANGGNAGTPVYASMDNGLKGGYAVSGHDTGHIGAMNDSSYAIGHPEQVVDFGWRSLHEVALAAGAPANYWPELKAFGADFLRFLREDPARWISPAKLEMVQRVVREECGAIDGILDDPASCKFDFSRLACTGAAGPDCLTEGERASIERRFTDLVDEEGKLIYPSYVHGLETDIGSSWIGRSADERGVSGSAWAFPVGFFRDYVHGDPDWQITEFDLSRDLPAARQGLIGFSVAAEDADLSRFAARGGSFSSITAGTTWASRPGTPSVTTRRWPGPWAVRMRSCPSTGYSSALAWDVAAGGTGPMPSVVLSVCLRPLVTRTTT